MKNEWVEKRNARHIYRVEDGEIHWYSALNVIELVDVLVEEWGDICVEDVKEIVQLEDDSLLELTLIDEEGQPLVRKTCKEWASAGKGQVGSTVY